VTEQEGIQTLLSLILLSLLIPSVLTSALSLSAPYRPYQNSKLRTAPPKDSQFMYFRRTGQYKISDHASITRLNNQLNRSELINKVKD